MTTDQVVSNFRLPPEDIARLHVAAAPGVPNSPLALSVDLRSSRTHEASIESGSSGCKHPGIIAVVQCGS